MQRNFNFLGNMRLDVPHFRLMEAAVTADFQALAGKVMAGEEPLVVSGFTITPTAALGVAAEDLYLVTAGGALMHSVATESGGIFTVPSTQANEQLVGTNSKVVGSFTASQTNYIGVDLLRVRDSDTAASVSFLDTGAVPPAEFQQTVPLARNLEYRIYISTIPFSLNQNILPIAIVDLDASGNVTAISDARRMAYRAALGGNHFSLVEPIYSWTNRDATSHILDSTHPTATPFIGGDKDLTSLRGWMQAVMYRLWELGAGSNWYAPNTLSDLKFNYDPTQIFTETAENWYWENNTDLLWQGLRFFIARGSGGVINEIANQTAASAFPETLTALLDGECIYVDIDRTQDRTIAGGNPLVAAKGDFATLATSDVPGARQILAWRYDGQVYTIDRASVVNSGDFAHASVADYGIVLINMDPMRLDGDIICPTIDDSGYVLGKGLRSPGPLASALDIGTTLYDTAVNISQTGQLTSILGGLSVDENSLISGILSVNEDWTTAGWGFAVDPVIYAANDAVTDMEMAIFSLVGHSTADDAWALKAYHTSGEVSPASPGGAIYGLANWGIGVLGSSGSAGIGVKGSAHTGVYGFSANDGLAGAFGVRGECLGTNSGIGVSGNCPVALGTGVRGIGYQYGVYAEVPAAGDATSYGVYGLNSRSSGVGVSGTCLQTSGTGVKGVGHQYGVYAEVPAGADATSYGVYGSSLKSTGIGVYGINSNTVTGIAVKGSGAVGIFGDGAVYGVKGTTAGAASVGTYGENTSNEPGSIGVEGVSGGIGVRGTGVDNGVKGVATGASGAGVYGENGYDDPAVIGVSGNSTHGVGVSGVGGAVGVYGFAADSNGIAVHGQGDIAIKGESAVAAGYGVHASNTAGRALLVEGDATTPALAAMRVSPQNTDPTGTSLAGDTYVNTTSGKESIHDGANWNRVVGRVHYAAGARETLTGTSGDPQTFASKFTVDGTKLKLGSTIRARVGLTAATDDAGAMWWFLKLGSDTIAAIQQATADTPKKISIEAEMTVFDSSGGNWLLSFVSLSAISHSWGEAAGNFSLCHVGQASVSQAGSSDLTVVINIGLDAAKSSTLYVFNVDVSD